MSSINEVLAGLQAVSAWQERVYKDIHAHPELSFQETKTAALVAAKLKEFGYEVLEGVGHTGVVGILRNGGGRTVLARADMDALPVRENTERPTLRRSPQLMMRETQLASRTPAAMTRM